MKNLLFIAILSLIGLNINSQNVTVQNLGVYLSSNTTNEGESLPIGSNLNLTNTGASVDCLFEFTYVVNNGAMPANTSVQEVLSIPSTGNSSIEYSVGPVAFSNFTFPNPGDVNVTVEAYAINCSLTNRINPFAGSSLFVFAAAPIPTLGQWGIMILGILIVVFGVIQAKEARQKDALA